MPASSEITTELGRCSGAVGLHLNKMKIGAFGEVRMCVHRETGAQRAVKVLRKSHMEEDEKKMLFNEINILRELVSANPLFSLRRPILFYYINEGRVSY